mgnify:CR=1 FL=1
MWVIKEIEVIYASFFAKKGSQIFIKLKTIFKKQSIMRQFVK